MGDSRRTQVAFPSQHRPLPKALQQGVSFHNQQNRNQLCNRFNVYTIISFSLSLCLSLLCVCLSLFVWMSICLSVCLSCNVSFCNLLIHIIIQKENSSDVCKMILDVPVSRTISNIKVYFQQILPPLEFCYSNNNQLRHQCWPFCNNIISLMFFEWQVLCCST